MERGGPFGFGDTPDDFSGAAFGSSAFGAGGVDDGDAPQRGWLPPEDRLWRHPSEMRAGDGAGATPPTGGGRRPRGVNRLVAATVGVMGAAAVASVAIAVTRPPDAAPGRVLAATDTSLTTAPLSSAAATRHGVSIGPDVVQLVDAMRASLVTLYPQGGGAARVTGVVLPGGDLVATAAGGVGDATRFDVVSADGRQQSATLAGTDARGGVAVVRLSQRLTAAAFADEPVSVRQLAVAACICGGAGRAGGEPDVAIGMVRQVGTAATLDGGPSLVDAIEAEMPFGTSSWGSVLLDDRGQVLGILDGERSTGDDVLGYFVPSTLAVGVAQELAASHHVARGWMGVVCADAPDGGAVVTTVLPGSPAADAGLRPGDVVQAVDAHAVASLADLQARLYTTEPGTRLLLTVVRGAAVSTTPVVVRSSPS